MTIQVRLFAALREEAGTSALALELPDDATVEDAVNALAARYPPFKRRIASLAYAVNQSYAKPHTILKEGDELALIPPVSGG